MSQRSHPETAPVQAEITLDGVAVAYSVTFSSRTKYLRLEIAPGTGLVVVLPKGREQDAAVEFLTRRKDWVLRNLARYGPVHVQKGWDNSTRLRYLGRELTVEVRRQGKVDTARLVGNKLMINVVSGLHPEVIIEKWFRLRASKLVLDRVQAQSKKMGVKYNNFHIRAQKTRWASCSAKGNLSFNWKLVMAPGEVIDYVVIHELAHLKELNHSPRFWALVAAYCPSWQKQRKWLRENARRLIVPRNQKQ